MMTYGAFYITYFFIRNGGPRSIARFLINIVSGGIAAESNNAVKVENVVYWSTPTFTSGALMFGYGYKNRYESALQESKTAPSAALSTFTLLPMAIFRISGSVETDREDDEEMEKRCYKVGRYAITIQISLNLMTFHP